MSRDTPGERHACKAPSPGDEDRFWAIFDHAGTGIGFADTDGRILRVNEVLCEILGASEEELRGIPFLLMTHPDDRDRTQEMVRRLLAGEIPRFIIEKRVVRKAGGERWVRSSVSLIRDATGNPANLIAVIEDITAHRQAEERLRASERRERARAAELAALLEAVPAIVFVAHDPDCRLVTGSRATYELLRRPPGSNISKSAAVAEMSHVRVMKDGIELSPEALPVQRAARGEELCGFEEQVVFTDGCSRYLYGHAIPLRDEHGGIYGAMAAFLDITELKRAEQRQRLLTAELGHRVNNTLAVVQAIASQTFKRAPSPEGFIVALQGRLRALATAHALLTGSRWQAASLAGLVRQALAAHGAQEGATLALDGADVSLSSRQAVMLGLVLHELATNAAKYGALSTPTGRVEVCWAVEGRPDAARLRFDWRETGGPPVEQPRVSGFGTGLIRQGIAYELKGMATLGFEPDGLRCTILLPWGAAPPGPAVATWTASSAG